ncbi:TRAP transporter substrate-binding protein, partial [Leclercia adecarboxylata]|nr:TRAP transporter substrate-binding protein [Leclercia adecarboxylata]
MNLKRKLLVTALPFAFCISGLAHAMTLKIAEIHPTGYPTVVAMENLGKKLEAATNGEIKSRMFAGGVLGSEKEVIEQTQ